MKQKSFSTITESFNLTIIFTFFLFSKIIYGADPQYESCKPKYCGNQSISFPFIIKGKQEPYCGFPGFDLTCQNDFPILHTPENDYSVRKIFYGNQSLRLSNAAVLNPYGGCSPPIRNSSIDEEKFEIDSNVSYLHLLSSCSSLPNELSSYRINVGCGANGSGFDVAVFGEEDGKLRLGLERCETDTVAPVELRGGDRVGDYVDLLRRGFLVNWKAPNCSHCERSRGRCGFESQTSSFRCFCPDRPHHVRCRTGSKFSKRNRILIATALSVGVCMIVLGLLRMVFLSSCLRKKLSTGTLQNLPIPFCKKKKSNIVQNLEAFLEECGSLAPKRYSYSEIKKMTDSFKDQLGNGGYGCVYKGKLHDGRMVAVKVLNESKGDGEEFANEVSSISKTSHVNIVKLVGFCFGRSKRALIYDFMPNGSLEKYIFEKNQGEELITPLGWERTYNIAIGIAYGLEYLHHGCSTRILHLDIKPQNILLDQDFCPKISDFGLARLCLKRESRISMVGMRGTIGYIAPEVFSRNFGKVSYKSDVFSYGMLILEMVVGRKNIDAGSGGSSETYFPHWIHKCLEMDEDLKLKWATNEREEEVARKMVLVALWCVQTDPASRPSMDSVVAMLEGSHENIQVPPKPFPYFPPQRTPAPDSNTSSHSLLQESDDTFGPSSSHLVLQESHSSRSGVIRFK